MSEQRISDAEVGLIIQTIQHNKNITAQEAMLAFDLHDARAAVAAVTKERDEAVTFIRVLGEETESGGDRNRTLAKVRALIAERDAAIARAERAEAALGDALQSGVELGTADPGWTLKAKAVLDSARKESPR